MLHVALSPRPLFQVAIRASAELEPVAIRRKPACVGVAVLYAYFLRISKPPGKRVFKGMTTNRCRLNGVASSDWG